MERLITRLDQGLRAMKKRMTHYPIDTTFGSFTKYGMEPSVYIVNDQAIGSRLKFNYGLCV